MVILFVVLGVMNSGSYDPYNELTVLSPDSVQATSDFSIPEVEIPEIPELPMVENASSADTFQSCVVTASQSKVANGAAVTIYWETRGFSAITLNGVVVTELSGSKTFENVRENTTYTLSAKTADGKSECKTSVTVLCLPPVEVPKFCELTLTKSVDKTSAKPGDELVYTIKIKNTGTADCTGGGVRIVDIHDTNISYLSETHSSNLNAGYGSNPVYLAAAKTLSWNGNTLNPNEEGTITWKGKVTHDLACGIHTTVKNSAKATAKELNNFSTWSQSNMVETDVYKACDVPVPTCDAFAANQTTITKGDSASLNWVTSNTDRVTINNGIGEVAATGTISVTPLSDITYILNAYRGTVSEKCEATITVKEPPVVTVPKCEAFTATPSRLPVGGGNVALAWNTTNATAVSISPTIGSVSVNGSSTVALASTTTFTLNAFDAKENKDSCVVTVPVDTPVPTPISCLNNVSLTASDATIRRGEATTISWTTSGGITGVSFDNGITSTGLSGSTSVTPTNSTTYNLTATDGKNTITCPMPINVSTGGGGGGGGSASPRCELSVSDNKISLGEKVVLKWDSSLATSLFIEDKNTGETLVTTNNLSSKEKDRLFDGSLTVSPRKDTTYLMTIERGSKKRTCSVDVDVVNNIVVTQIRDQQPLVAGISLSQVPYTGFEAGPILTLLFYTLLMTWALYVAYLLVIRRDDMGGVKFASVQPATRNPVDESFALRPDVFVEKVQAPMAAPRSLEPANLPTGLPVIGYGSDAKIVSNNVHNIDDAEMTRIENYAHAQKVLLSSDAIRHFIATTNNKEERLEALDQVLKASKSQFPSEDGWVVLNEKRMKDTCVICTVNNVSSNESPYVPAVIPEGAGSLAESIVTGNVIAAYEMIGNRPMFALADAAADLDAIYRIRKGGKGSVSDLLKSETTKLTDEQILKMIEALTGALDGTYTDEEAAVKMSIMKAIKVVA